MDVRFIEAADRSGKKFWLFADLSKGGPVVRKFNPNPEPALCYDEPLAAYHMLEFIKRNLSSPELKWIAPGTLRMTGYGDHETECIEYGRSGEWRKDDWKNTVEYPLPKAGQPPL